jgi:hypothetical protein
MEPKSYKKTNAKKKVRACKRGTASQAIGIIEKESDTFILTYGQFSLIDALVAILDQTGPAHVSVSTWTAAHADLSRSAELMEAVNILSLRMIVDRSFKTRQPKYYEHMICLFGEESIRAINTHAKFMTIRNEKFDIVVRTSMNLNGNPRLENIEVSENSEFADFFEEIVTGIFEEVEPGEQISNPPELNQIEESPLFKLVSGKHIDSSNLKEASYSHELDKKL